MNEIKIKIDPNIERVSYKLVRNSGRRKSRHVEPFVVFKDGQECKLTKWDAGMMLNYILRQKDETETGGAHE